MGARSIAHSPEGARERLCRFFLGAYYPALIAVIIFLGYLFSIEVFTFLPVAGLAAAGAILTGSARPFIIFATAFLFQMSPEHSPGFQSGFSDYYFTEWRLPLLILSFGFVAAGVVTLIVKKGLYRGISFKKIPLLAPAIGLSFAFLLNGAFSSGWSAAGLGFGACQVLIYLILFLFFFLALRGECAEELAKYFAYVSAVVALLLLAEIALPYIRLGGIPEKEQMLLGWGIWNTAGVSITVLIPMCFLGAVRSERFSWCYFAVAIAALIGAVMTQSRNALLIGALVFAVCVLVCCFVGRYKKAYRVICAAGAVCVLVGAVVLGDRLSELLSSFFADNGRYTLWQIGIDNFLKAPLFGVGFYSFVSDTFTSTTFLPDMAHCTPIEILSAMGAFGIAAYLVYRVFSLMPLFRRPDTTKLMLALSIIAMLLGGLLDNFVFYFLPALHYSVALAILQLCENDDVKECAKPSGKE